MKTDWLEVEQFRIQPRGYESPEGATWGWFVFRFGKKQVRCMTVDGQETGWEHVSVSVSVDGGSCRMPTWDEMCFVKSKFWDAEECVIQFHPPAAEYVNNHVACLHLWKFTGGEFPLPPSIFVGLKELNLS